MSLSDAQYIIVGEFRAASRVAARMNLGLRQWVHIQVPEVTQPIVFSRLGPEEVAALKVPGSGYPRRDETDGMKP